MKPQRPEKEAHSPEPSRDAVEINSEDSFPASDAPSWTPVRRSDVRDCRPKSLTGRSQSTNVWPCRVSASRSLSSMQITGDYFGGTENSGSGTGDFLGYIRNHHRMRFSVHTTAFSASSRLFDLNGAAKIGITKHSSAIMVR